MNLIGTIHS